uniref:Uncharacterized protein n=1 Tax=Arundo donax TaxID=35708 RepID=A0A0A9DR75_ARUDO
MPTTANCSSFYPKHGQFPCSTPRGHLKNFGVCCHCCKLHSRAGAVVTLLLIAATNFVQS